MLFMVLLVVIALLTKAMPVFEQVFSQFGFTMTGIAGILRDIGDALNRYAVIFCVVLIIILILCLLMRITSIGKSISTRIFETSIFTKSLAAKLSLQRFALAMSGMLSCGIDWDQSMELAGTLITNNYIHSQINIIRQAVKHGASFQFALESSGIFPGKAMALLAMGIQTGTASDAFQMIGESITAETESKINRLVAAIEPAMVFVMCTLVGLVLLSVMLPILGMLTSM